MLQRFSSSALLRPTHTSSRPLDNKIVLQLGKLIWKDTFKQHFSVLSDIICQTCLNTFGVKQHQARGKSKKIRRQREMETLSRQKKDLEKHNEKSYQRTKKWATAAM